MAHLTKKQQQERLVEAFLECLRKAPAGERVYLAVGDLFKPAEVHDLAGHRALQMRGDGADSQEDT